MNQDLTYQERRTATRHVGGGLILRELEAQVRRQVLRPLIQLARSRPKLGNIDVVTRFRRVEIVKNRVQNSRRGEEGNGAGQSRGLARKGGQETGFGDVLVIDILGILSTDILLTQEDRQTSQGRSQSGAVSCGTIGRKKKSDLPIQDILAPEHLLTRLTHERVAEVLLALVQSQLMANANSNTPIAQQTGIIGLGHAMDLSQDKALQSRDGNVGGERLEGGGPILLEESGVLVGSRLERVSNFPNHQWWV